MTNRAISGRSPRDYSGRMGNSSSARGLLRHPNKGSESIELIVIDGYDPKTESEIEIKLITTGTKKVSCKLKSDTGYLESYEGYSALDERGKCVPFEYPEPKFDPERAKELSDKRELYTIRYRVSEFFNESCQERQKKF